MTNCHSIGRISIWRKISNHYREGRTQSVQCSVYFWYLLSICARTEERQLTFLRVAGRSTFRMHSDFKPADRA